VGNDGWGDVDPDDDVWADVGSTVTASPTFELVYSRVWLAWVATGFCALSALFIPLGQLWPGYLAGVVASVVCMLAILDDRERQSSPNFVRKAPIEQWARWVRVTSFLVCLVHIVRLAQEAAK
jgi:hypothetical protein